MQFLCNQLPDFKNSWSCLILTLLWIEQCTMYPQHLNYATTLPCKTLPIKIAIFIIILVLKSEENIACYQFKTRWKQFISKHVQSVCPQLSHKLEVCWRCLVYEGRSINKLQNGAIPLIVKIWKIRNIRFVGNLILNIQNKIFDDDVIIVTSAVHRTQSIGVLFSPPVITHSS